jgi:ribosomal protein L40E
MIMNENPNLNPDADQETEEQELCTQCLTSNRPDTNFCRKCGAPLSSYAAIGPYESLLAEGYVYRKASEQPQHLIVVLGIWVIFGFSALAGAFFVFINWNYGNLFSVLFGIGLLVVSVLLIGKTTRNYCNRQVSMDEDQG